MSKNRNIYEGGIYHVYNRGVAVQKIFKNKLDYEYFLKKVDFYKSIIGVCILAYSFLPNHFHFLLQEPPNPGLTCQPRVGYVQNTNQYEGSVISKFIGLLSHSYTKYFNNKYDRSGRLFEYVFKSKEISDEKYLESISDYVYFNPVKHKLVDSPENWKYSFQTKKSLCV